VTRNPDGNRQMNGISRTVVPALACALLASTLSITTAAQTNRHRTFATAEDAVKALITAANAGSLDELLAIFGADGQDLIASSDPATGRRNREVFTIAVAEQWRLEGGANRRTLVIGNEDWPFPVPLVKEAGRWRFDTAAGREEVLARRIGRNELAAIQTCRAYVTAQQRYAQHGHDGKPVGLFASTFRSDPGKENGLYWPAARGQKRSPLGELVGAAAEEGRPLGVERDRSPFHGYYFRILTAQGTAAPGGARSYVLDGEMSAGFALVAWPAQYNVTGVMTFVVNQDGIVHEKDLGDATDAAARSMTQYNPDASWHPVK
jgi:Protein of unknown function (DUF2950)